MNPEGLTAQAVADLVGGRLIGDGTAVVRRVAPLDRAGPDALAFVASSRFLPEFRASAAGAVLVPAAVADEPDGPATRIVVAAPYRAVREALHALYPAEPPVPGVHPSAVIGEGAELGADVSVGARVVLGRGVRLGDRVRLAAGAILEDGVEVGADTVIGPNAVCYRGARIGARVLIKGGAVVGGDGFGYVSGAEGHDRIPHIGGCVLEDEVEVGSNTTIDRGSIGDTVIGRGTKIDNLVQIGHNVRIGARCLVMGMVGIGGSTRVGDGVILAGKSAVADHLVIGDGARIGAAALVITDVPAGVDWSGYPGRRHREALRTQAAMLRLPALIAELERMVKERNGRE